MLQRGPTERPERLLQPSARPQKLSPPSTTWACSQAENARREVIEPVIDLLPGSAGEDP
jgi:hypothetical protein